MKYMMLLFLLFSVLTGGVAQNAKELQLTANVSESGCAGTKHTIAVEAHGGTAPYTYNWSDNKSGGFRNDLKGGTYTCTVTDAAGKIARKTFTLAQLPQELTANARQEKAGDKTIVRIEAVGGTAPYSYFWLGRGLPSTESKEKVRDLTTGNYQIVVRDRNGCSVSVSVSIQ